MNDDSPTEVQKDQMVQIAVLDELDNTSDKIGTLVILLLHVVMEHTHGDLKAADVLVHRASKMMMMHWEAKKHSYQTVWQPN